MALSPPETAASTPVLGHQTERRISWLTLGIGFAVSVVALAYGHSLWAVGVAIGAVLGWLNFRWLGKGLDALVVASTAQEGRPKAQVPQWTYFAAAFRYALIALSVYVIFTYLHVPLVSLIVGLCALGAAAIVASVYEILRPVGR
jgi:ATP synthase I chain